MFHMSMSLREFALRVVTCLTIVFCVTTCWADESAANDGAERRVIVCSTTQIADFSRQVVGDRWVVDCVMAPGADPHMYIVTPEATNKVRRADLCLDNGMHLEGGDWMRKLSVQEGKPIVSCTDGMMPLMIEADGDVKPVPDPHAWFSVKNASQYVRNILRAVIAHDPDGEAEYTARAACYLEQLRALHGWLIRQFNVIPPSQRVLVTSHDAFNYFCRDYDFQASSPVGWSTQEVGAELTPARRKKVIDSIADSGVKAIFVETSVNPEAIQQIAEEAGVMVGGKLYSDSMGSSGTLGETYIGMMRENALTIITALTDGHSD